MTLTVDDVYRQTQKFYDDLPFKDGDGDKIYEAHDYTWFSNWPEEILEEYLREAKVSLLAGKGDNNILWLKPATYQITHDGDRIETDVRTYRMKFEAVWGKDAQS